MATSRPVASMPTSASTLKPTPTYKSVPITKATCPAAHLAEALTMSLKATVTAVAAYTYIKGRNRSYNRV